MGKQPASANNNFLDMVFVSFLLAVADCRNGGRNATSRKSGLPLEAR